MIFKEQAENFILTISNRRSDPVAAGTIHTYRNSLRRATESLGNKDLSEVTNKAVKELVDAMVAEKRSSSSINLTVYLVKQVVASAVNDEGDELYPRKWNSRFINVPSLTVEKTPIASPESITEAISRASTTDKALYALLAGSGLRIGEALALLAGPDNGVDSTWDPQMATVHIRTTFCRATGEIQPNPKTEAGNRTVDLDPKLNDFLKATINPVEGQPVFPRTSYVAYDERRKRLGVIDGFHSLRRFRITHLQSQRCIPGLEYLWAGHAPNDVHGRYVNFDNRIKDRRIEVERIGLGFQLEA
jgi:integrase